jgi:hypothetical protein
MSRDICLSVVLTIGIIASLHRDASAEEWQHVQTLETGTRIRIMTTGRTIYAGTGKVVGSDAGRIIVATP